ncbi:hypothetical protein BaRGS_00039313, partial [Batillaria attramentaria]
GAHCPTGWTLHENSCYIYISDSYNWHDAQANCAMWEAGRLVEIHSAAENVFVTNMARANSADAVWIGLNDIAQEGKWVWDSSQQPAQFTNWGHGQPDNHNFQHEPEDCAVIWHLSAERKWNDGNCDSVKTPSICETE